MRWPFCLRCLHEIHYKSVHNLRPPHAPVIAICPVFVTVICSDPHFPLQKKKQQQKTNQSEKLTVFLYTDEYTDRQTDTLASCDSFQPWGRNWLCIIDPHEMKSNLSTTISIFLSLAWTLLSPLSIQDSRKISSSYRHHHNLYSLDNNKKGILYTSFQMCH